MTDDAGLALAGAKDRMATAALGGRRAVRSRLGELTLRPHQVTAVARLLSIMGRFRGALLADAVGLGKTYVALAIAAEHERPLIMCPAALRPMWQRASAMSAVPVPVMTLEAIARGDQPGFVPDLIVVDEAHHLRNPGTHRYGALAHLAHRARLLLMSATPLQNSRRDLTAVLALFAGSGVSGWTDGELARLIVRRDERSANEVLPGLDGPHPLSPGADDDCLDAILELPSAVPTADEGVAAALAAFSLVHLWASSRAALVASLRKRRARALALRDAIESGHVPTAAELAAWQYADESLQLAFPFCVATDGPAVDTGDLGRRLDEYACAAGVLIARCQLPPDPDQARVTLLQGLRARHVGDRIVAFSQYAQTVASLGRRMRGDRGVAVVTAGSARIASGPVTRREVLEQFAGDARPTAAAERIDLLLSTDLLSEGVDLRGAAVIVHLDLPWNPARLEQRVGRARRLGSRHESIHVYTFVPPSAAERMLELQRRLAGKVSIADKLLGGCAGEPIRIALEARSAVGAGESLRASLLPWLDPTVSREGDTIIAAATSKHAGWLALVTVDDLPCLVHSSNDKVGDDPAGFLKMAAELGQALPPDPLAAQKAIAVLGQWMQSRQAIADTGAAIGYSPAKRAVLDRLAQSVARAPRHRRTTLLGAAQRARQAIVRVTGVGAERILATLAQSTGDDDAWIQSVEAFGSVQASNRPPVVALPAIEALILLTTDSTIEPPVASESVDAAIR